MAGRVQGITVEIGGDTTKLQTALKGVNTEIRNTQSQLRDVDKLLKLDPGNTELLAQKHRMLGDAVKETKEKLETLKTAEEQAEQALKEGTITQDQYDGLQREIAKTEAKLKSLEEQAKSSATALQEIAAKGEKLKTVGDNITNVGKKFLPVTGGVTALGTAAVKTAADFDTAMSKVAAVSGATGSDFDALRDKARKMGAKTKFSASEAAEAMNYMAMAGWKTGDMLSGIEGVMNLAAASGEDLETTSDIVTDALTAFGLTEAGTTQRDVVREGIVEISVSFHVSKMWLMKLSAYKKLAKITVGYLDTATMNIVNTQMYIDGFKSRLAADTSYGGLWEVSFTLKEF